ncbi:hypothetical protein L1987_53907 [Smallanthus sonchifolius]|uniref:Uncharacterized protein n=1 Tax=Smallanthus sonchifolius TaxID=185202 RepID=A0ACB9E5C9_9ASTR|nr:hypothetical protein L1987_53907 [Smallanthus sonchifolius]
MTGGWVGGLKGNYLNTFRAWDMEQACKGLQREMGRGMCYYGSLVTLDLVYCGPRRQAEKGIKEPQARQIKPWKLISNKIQATLNIIWNSNKDNLTGGITWNGNPEQELGKKINPSDTHLRENENVIMNIASIDPTREDESTGSDANQIMKDSEVTEKELTGNFSHSNSASPGAISQIEDNVAWDRLNSQRVILRWPKQWGESMCTELSNIGWENIMQSVKSSWAMEYGEGDQGFPNWLDVERGACNPEETMHRKKKKRKNKGRNPFRGQKIAPPRDGENLSRRTIRVVSSKERNKDLFPQNLSFPKVMPPPLGLSEFWIGNESKDKSNQQVSKAPSSNRIDSLYKELMAKESRLKEIANNILKTDANSVLLHSILSMKSCNLRKFSSKVNDNGVVTIDEDMVDTGSGDLDTNINFPGTPIASYAKNAQQRSQCYPGGKDPILPAISQKSRSIREEAGTDNKTKRGNNASIRMMNRNIIINGQRTHDTQDRGNKRDTGAQEQGTSNTPASPIQDTTGLNANSQSESLLEKEKSSGIPNVRMVETSNRFMLLYEEGNELAKNSGGVDINVTKLYDGKNINSGWIRKQLCSLYDFGPGYRAVNREDEHDPPVNNLDMDDSRDNQEEVESETDATAQMMNIDGPPVVATNSYCLNNMVLDGPI